ncbi:MAG: ABC transporter ATP-binding protein [Candidatus Heimdallarchaeota archaeon]
MTEDYITQQLVEHPKDSLPIIEFSNVYKNYGHIQALQGVSFGIMRGEIFGYIGPNGAGKTTTLKILVGLISDYTGELRVANELLAHHENLGAIIGYMPQEVGFQQWRTVEEALTTFGRLSGMTKELINQRIPEVLELLQLSDARKRKIKNLSGGMQQKLKLAQALIHNPQVLVLDEPLAGLDPTSRYQLKNTIRELAQHDITIIFSSHILGEVEDIATSIGIIDRGRITKLGRPQDLQDELIGGEAIEIIGPKITTVIEELETQIYVEKVQAGFENPNKIVVFFKSNVAVDNCKLLLLELLVKNQIPVRNFNYLKPSLEQVYLRYVEGVPTE